MDVFALLFILSFIALLVTLVVMSICKSINKGKGDCKEEVESTETSSSDKMYAPIVGKTTYEFETSWYQREVNEAQEKWKETVPKHSTRTKLREARKLRNKRKGKKK